MGEANGREFSGFFLWWPGVMFARCMYPDQILNNERELIVFLCHFIIYDEYKNVPQNNKI